MVENRATTSLFFIMTIFCSSLVSCRTRNFDQMQSSSIRATSASEIASAGAVFISGLINQESSSFEDVIANLPAELRKNAMYVFDSRSDRSTNLSAANDQNTLNLPVPFLFPRIVLFNSDASMSVAFASNPESEKYGTIEAMEYLEDLGRFRVHKATYSKQGSWSIESDLSSELEHSLRNRETKVTIEWKENPSSECSKCHRASLRPNWESYPIWAGFLGGTEGSTPNSEYSKWEELAVARLVDRKHDSRILSSLGAQSAESIERVLLEYNDAILKIALRRIKKNFLEFAKQDSIGKSDIALFLAVGANSPEALDRADKLLGISGSDFSNRQKRVEDFLYARWNRHYAATSPAPKLSLGVSNYDAEPSAPIATLMELARHWGMSSEVTESWNLSFEREQISFGMGKSLATHVMQEVFSEH